MAYSNTFGGAAKDAAEDTILGADLDTEFDNIATEVALKANKVVAPTAGNILEVSSGGDLVDSGVASVNLDGLTGVIQTQLDAKADRSAAATGHERAGNIQLLKGDTATTAVVPTTLITEDAWESFGPTGSGATNIWADMDDMPADARILIALLEVQLTLNGTDANASVYAVSNDVTTPGPTNANRQSYWEVDGANGDVMTHTDLVFIPVDSSQIFKMSWSVSASDTVVATLHYRGFIVD